MFYKWVLADGCRIQVVADTACDNMGQSGLPQGLICRAGSHLMLCLINNIKIRHIETNTDNSLLISTEGCCILN